MIFENTILYTLWKYQRTKVTQTKTQSDKNGTYFLLTKIYILQSVVSQNLITFQTLCACVCVCLVLASSRLLSSQCAIQFFQSCKVSQFLYSWVAAARYVISFTSKRLYHGWSFLSYKNIILFEKINQRFSVFIRCFFLSKTLLKWSNTHWDSKMFIQFQRACLVFSASLDEKRANGIYYILFVPLYSDNTPTINKVRLYNITCVFVYSPVHRCSCSRHYLRA